MCTDEVVSPDEIITERNQTGLNALDRCSPRCNEYDGVVSIIVQTYY